MKTDFKRRSVVLAIGLMGLSAASGNAYAGAYTFASSIVSLTLYNSNSSGTVLGPILDASQFNPGLSVQDSSSTSANLATVPGVSTDGGVVGLTSGNAEQACQGTGCGIESPANVFSNIPENQFTTEGTGSWYARSDTNVTGAIITGIPGKSTPATASSISEVSLLGNDVGISSANVNNTTGFSFVLSSADPRNTGYVVFDLSATTATRSMLTADQSIPPSAAGSSGTWSISITDNTLPAGSPAVFTWSPDAIKTGSELFDNIDLTFNSSVSSAGADTGLVTFTNTARTVSPLLVLGRNYTLQISQTNQSNAQSDQVPVPEPSIIALMGIGLLVFGTANLRNHKAAV